MNEEDYNFWLRVERMFFIEKSPLLIGEKREENSPCGEFMEVKFPFLSRKGNFQKGKFHFQEFSTWGIFLFFFYL